MTDERVLSRLHLAPQWLKCLKTRAFRALVQSNVTIFISRVSPVQVRPPLFAVGHETEQSLRGPSRWADLQAVAITNWRGRVGSIHRNIVAATRRDF
jgi:hypothetical protein